MRCLFSVALLTIASPAIGQDMLAVDWSSQVYALDTYAVTASLVGTGLFGQNGMAVDRSGTVWSTHMAGSNPNWSYSLTNVDPWTGAGTIVHSGIPDVRALARADTSRLWAIVNGNPDVLYSVDTVSGTFTRVGSTGCDGLQGLATRGGNLYGWNITRGLMLLDTGTGLATDVNPAIGGPGGGGIQFLAVRADGALIGGKSDLYQIDPASGQYTLLGSLGAGIDLRGADEWFGNVHYFGAGCAGAYGPVSLRVTGTFGPGGQAVVDSGNHAAGALGALVLGFSREAYLSQSLPILLDPAFGTSGCSLLVSIDGALFGLASSAAPADLSFPLALPATTAGMVVHLQHVTFEPVPGSMSWSDAATLRISY